jgi:hypothetical protein
MTEVKSFLKFYLEKIEILEQQNQWSLKMHFDGYEGWIDSKQYQVISESNLISFLTTITFKF